MSDPKVHPLAGKPAPPSLLVNVPKLVTAYYREQPDPSVPAERILFGTSGHRGSSLSRTFNEKHVRHNRGRTTGLADGIVITPSHNPPEYGGFKYDPPSGGPADTEVTTWIEKAANALLADDLRGVARIPYERVIKAATVHRFDYVESYVGDLGNVIDMEPLRGARSTSVSIPLPVPRCRTGSRSPSASAFDSAW